MSLARVTHAEANLLTLARCVVSGEPVTELQRLLLVSIAPPAKLGPTSAALLEDTLARGTVRGLLASGGWTRELDGRWWDGALPPLHFTANVIRLLHWALKLPLAELEVSPLQFEGALTPAEEVFALLFVTRAKDTAAEATVMSQPALRKLPLVQLAHAASLARVGPLAVAPPEAAHLPWVRGLLDLLGDAWLDAELSLPRLLQPRVLAAVGRARLTVATAFLDVLEAKQQRHLARFFIDAAAAWLARHQSASELVLLDPETPLRERAEARREAGALWRIVQRLEQWDQQHRATRFIDDGYDVAQALVKDWERLGPHGFAAATRLLAELEALPG